MIFAHLIEKAPYMNSLAGLITRNLEPTNGLFIENYSPSSLEEILNRLNSKNCFLTIYYKISEVENTIFLSGVKTPTAYIGETAVQFAETIRKNLSHALAEWTVYDLGEVPFAELRDSGSAHIFIHVPQNIDLERFAINICNFIATTFPSYFKVTADLLTTVSETKAISQTVVLTKTEQNLASSTNTNPETETDPEQVTVTTFDEDSLAELSRELLILSQQQNFSSEMPGLDNFSSKRRNTSTPTEPAFSISSAFNPLPVTSTSKIITQTPVPLTNYSTSETNPTSILTGSPFLPPGAVLELLPYEEYELENENPAPPSWLAP